VRQPPSRCCGRNPSDPNNIATAINAIFTSVAFLRPMDCNSRPSGQRNGAPAMMGTDRIRSVRAGLSEKVSLMDGAVAPVSTQIQQENAK
jgi:hypothetical protein